MARRAMKLMKSGETPGGCRSREECETYCMEEGHMEECIEFGVKAGFMNEEEAQRMREGGSFGSQEGPGGCRGEEECFEYCMDEAHQDECMEFGEQMMGEEEREEMERVREEMLRYEDENEESFEQEMMRDFEQEPSTIEPQSSVRKYFGDALKGIDQVLSI